MLVVSRLFLLVIALAVIGGIVALIVALASGKKKEEAAPTEDRSYFDGGYLAYIGYSLLVGLVTTITFGIAFPWMCCMLQRWKAKHTVVCGKRMRFDGTGVQLIGRFLLWMLLTLITFGIYGFWMVIAVQKWISKHTHFVGEEDDNSYFDGGFWGFIGMNILTFFVTLVPVVGFAWADIMRNRWFTEHTVIDSRRLVFTGTVGKFFLKYLLWGFLTAITFGIFGLFVPVKAMRLVAEHTIDHEHTPEALMKQSEYRNIIRTDCASFKTYRVEDEMEGIKAGINDTTEKDALKALADGGNRAAQYLYAVRYAEGQFGEEPFSSMLKASAEAEYAPAMSLYGLTHSCEGRNELLQKAAARGQLAALRECMALSGAQAFSTSEKEALPLLKETVRCGDLLKESSEELTAEEQELYKKCVLAIRKIESGIVKASGGGKIAAIVIAAVLAFFLILGVLCAALFNLKMTGVRGPASVNTLQDGYSSMDTVAATLN